MDRALAGEHFIEVQYQPALSVWWELNWNPIRNEGKVIGLSVFVQDITDRRRSQEISRELEENFRNSPDSFSRESMRFQVIGVDNRCVGYNFRA